ncbi:MAG: phage holin family protein [Chitinophagaceae bacterium]|nr:phage holin family protein [Chitinophagaceae bacterium]
MEKTFAKVEEMAEHVKEYVNNHIASAKLNVAEKTSGVLANIIAMAVALMVFVFFIVFTSVALAFVFAKLTGEYYWGFLIVAGIYLLIGLLVWTMREKLLKLPIMNAILQQLFKEEEDADEKI